ncbi:MAG: hypothetical protein J6X28_02230 [Bacilli bacterium]|nr:hypothetical protein [Bacilli bacterium]
MRKARKQTFLSAILLLVLGLGLGYALITTNLTIEGTTDVDSNTWNVFWDNVVVTSGSVAADTPVISSGKTTVSFTVNLTEPGQFYEFTVDAKNTGTIDAMIDVASKTVNGSTVIPSYLSYEVTYDDNAPIALKQKLNAGTTETIKIRVEYLNDIDSSLLPSTPQALHLNCSTSYVQKDSTAIEIVRMNVGDYIRMYPSSQIYTLPAAVSGGSADVTISPYQLSLWRIIAKNSDGTIEAVSEYISPPSEAIEIGGITGYANYAAILQEIADQYGREYYTQSVRMMGYDGQTMNLSDLSAFNGTSISPPSTTSTARPTTGSGEEFQGGVLGDTLYLRDYQLVSNVYKTDPDRYGNSGLVAYTVDNPNGAYYYWIASRQYYYNSSSSRFDFGGSCIGPAGTISGAAFRSYYYGWGSSTGSYCVRPIITLIPDVVIHDGEGTIDNPYILQSPQSPLF